MKMMKYLLRPVISLVNIGAARNVIFGERFNE
jgi:hypothetical protein